MRRMTKALSKYAVGRLVRYQGNDCLTLYLGRLDRIHGNAESHTYTMRAQKSLPSTKNIVDHHNEDNRNDKNANQCS
jgi:hypothetical protein